ncbi:MAG: hypothetical protein MK102_05895 [Fuerstiella sp.]|nr:hypothetical protein [Fuerstiella sp.]
MTQERDESIEYGSAMNVSVIDNYSYSAEFRILWNSSSSDSVLQAGLAVTRDGF